MKKVFLLFAAILTATVMNLQAEDITSWTIAGDAAMMGSHWDPADTNNDMTLVGGVYKLTKFAYLTEGGFDYKACANHAWGIKEVPSSENQTLQIDEDGDYEIIFTLDAAGTTLTAAVVVPTPEIKEFQITGDRVVGSTLTITPICSGFEPDWSSAMYYYQQAGESDVSTFNPPYFTPTKAGNCRFEVEIINMSHTQEYSKDTTIYIAAPAPTPKIVVVYDLQGHGEAIENDTIESGSKITQPADPEAVGYEFRNWFTDAKGLGEAFDFSKTVTATKDSTITLYAKWRDPAAWEQFKKDLDTYSYVEYDSTYEAGFMIHLATTQDAQVQDIAVFIEASEEVLANYDFSQFIYQLLTEYPKAIDEIKKCMGIEAPMRRAPQKNMNEVENVLLKLISAYTQLPYRANGLNAVCGLYSSYVDLVYKAWAETNYENDADICKCMFNSDVFFKSSARLMEAFDVCEK